jgi:cytochrome c-type biogenesis protein
MPHIEQMHKQLGKDGLVVLGVNGESPDAAKGYLEQNGYTFPTLSDTGYQVSRLYGVRAIPTIVVIDREGKVSSYMRGLHSEAQLREAVQKAL